MHIPDGYLGPATYLSSYVACVPLWGAAARKVKIGLTARRVPLLAISAAFTFVVMMFNIPLPGATTGHAVGGVLIAIAVGPWGAAMAISIALAIQALLFGDGGITAIGANCLNMAFVMPFTGYAVYRWLARYFPSPKGQAIAAYDPRALKGNGVTYVTSPMGADHTAGNALETAKTINPLGIENQVEVSRKLQIRAAILDTMGLCLFTRPPFTKNPDLFLPLLKGRYGWDLAYADVQKMGLDVLETEREFNRRSGAGEEFNDMPEFMREEPLPPMNSVYDVPMEEMQRIWEVKIPENVF